MSTTTIKLSKTPDSDRKCWKFDFVDDEDNSNSKGSLSCASFHNENDGIDVMQLICSNLTSKTIISLTPYATSLQSLIAEKLFLRTSDLSPLLISPLGKGSLINLTLSLGSDDINGLITTVASTCPNLKSLSIYREEPSLDNNIFTHGSYAMSDNDSYAMEPWSVSIESFVLLASNCSDLRRLCLEQIHVKGRGE